MREMKDSGIEWIGEIPEKWNVVKIKHYCSSIYSGGTPQSNKEEYWDGDIPWIPSGSLKDRIINSAVKYITQVGLNNSSTKLIPKNTTVLALTGATCSKVGYLTFDSCANQSVVAYETIKESSKFLFYLLIAARNEILLKRTGGAQAGINTEDCKNIIVPYLPVTEQKTIANFLDDKCQKIDRLIALQEEMIEDLKAYKQSVITEAVTKGLDPTVPMKDSGIEWIGEIPEGWNVYKIGMFYDICLGKMLQPNKQKENDTLENYLCALNVGNNLLKLDVIKQMWFNNKEKENYLLRKGDLLVVEGGDVASSAIIDFDIKNTYFQNALHRVRSASVDTRFLRYWLMYAKTKGYIDLICNKATIAHFTKDKFINTPIISADLKTLEAIADHLDKKCANIDKLITNKQAKIEELKDYKKSLIYEYVTGKKGVV